MPTTQSKIVAECLAKPEIHDLWNRSHLTEETEPFYRMALDFILETLQPSKAETILDAGCGSCIHAIRVAQRGYTIQGVDFSEAALQMARSNIQKAGVGEIIRVQREDLTALSFADESFRHVWCWGVLMHIPEVERAIAELSRVTKHGGHLILSVANSRSLQAVATMIKTRLGIGQFPQLVRLSRTAQGYEYWTQSGAGTHLTRHCHISWLISEFHKHGLRVRTHVAGQFTEQFLKLPQGRIRGAIHSWNQFWFQRVRIPLFSFGNILIFLKD